MSASQAAAAEEGESIYSECAFATSQQSHGALKQAHSSSHMLVPEQEHLDIVKES
jgi:hypothetical protein